MEKTLDGILEDATPEEAFALRAIAAIAHQDGHLNQMSEGDKNLYGAKQVSERANLVQAAAEAVMSSGSARIQGLANDYLAKMAEVVNGNPNWGRSFSLDQMGIQRAVKEAIAKRTTQVIELPRMAAE